MYTVLVLRSEARVEARLCCPSFIMPSMDEKRFYTKKELAESLAVPESTLAGWIAQYSDFLPTQQVEGQRYPVYLPRALEVLIEVKRLRDANKQVPEITDALSSKYERTPRQFIEKGERTESRVEARTKAMLLDGSLDAESDAAPHTEAALILSERLPNVLEQFITMHQETRQALDASRQAHEEHLLKQIAELQRINEELRNENVGLIRALEEERGKSLMKRIFSF